MGIYRFLISAEKVTKLL